VGSTSEPRPAVGSANLWRTLWIMGLLLCPVSYLSLVVIRFSPLSGSLAAMCVALFLLSLVSSRQGRRRRLSGGAVALVLLAGGAVAGACAYYLNGGGQATALVVSVATALQITFIWIFLPWLHCDLTGAEYELRGGAVPEHRLPISTRSSLSFVMFTCFVLFGLGALWSRGELWVPSPTPWLAALAVFVLGAMLMERLHSLARSAREGNLIMPQQAHRQWVSAAIVLLVLASLAATLGPYRGATPVPTARTGSVRRESPAAPPPSFLRQEPRLSDAAAVLLQATSSLRALPRAALPLVLLLLLLLIAVVLVWLFQRSRAAAWLLAAVSWLIAKAVAAWQRLLAAFQRALAPASVPITEDCPQPPWATDPLFDVFEHPDILAGLTPREVVIRTYHLMLSFADMLGRGRRHSETPLEYARVLSVGEGRPSAALTQLTWSYVGAMYAGAAVVAPPPESIRAAWGRIAAALTAQLSPEELAVRRDAYLRRTSR